MIPSAITRILPLGFPWPTIDPFLLCVFHQDHFPPGNGRYGPPARELLGRRIGADVEGKDGWRMYHGTEVPGFPSHPHRGFETVTIIHQGLIDHADSLGAAARFGPGDVQWLTAGEGIVHSEMFPLLDTKGPNPLEMFQVWLNLPANRKRVPAHFTMYWAEDVPRHRTLDDAGRSIEVRSICGSPVAGPAPSLTPPPDSWASDPNADLAIWTLDLAAGARWTMPAAAGPATRRMLYFYAGQKIQVDGQWIDSHAGIELKGDTAVTLVNGDRPSQLLMLQGRPIGEPVAQHGPFVMNTRQELVQAYDDYQRTQFGGWPWADDAPVHGGERRRFARHVDGHVEERPLGHHNDPAN